MTLNTHIYLLDPIDHREVFLKCNQLLNATEAVRSYDAQSLIWEDGKSRTDPDGYWAIGNDIGQGLNALLTIRYRKGVQYVTAEQAAAHDEYCNIPENTKWYEPENPLCDSTYHDKECWIAVSFDTAYSYTGDKGEGCGDLHSLLVAQLGKWLDENGVRWRWNNEFTGETHDGYDGLDTLGSHGNKASAWFLGTVAPLIKQL